MNERTLSLLTEVFRAAQLLMGGIRVRGEQGNPEDPRATQAMLDIQRAKYRLTEAIQELEREGFK